MALADLLEKMERRAAVTPVTSSNPDRVTAKSAPTHACTLVTPVARQNDDIGKDARIVGDDSKAIRKLHGDPGLRYEVEAHDDIDLEAVILTLAIRGEAACELRIPKSRYDAFALMELIEKHTTRETLQ